MKQIYYVTFYGRYWLPKLKRYSTKSSSFSFKQTDIDFSIGCTVYHDRRLFIVDRIDAVPIEGAFQ